MGTAQERHRKNGQMIAGISVRFSRFRCSQRESTVFCFCPVRVVFPGAKSSHRLVLTLMNMACNKKGGGSVGSKPRLPAKGQIRGNPVGHSGDNIKQAKPQGGRWGTRDHPRGHTGSFATAASQLQHLPRAQPWEPVLNNCMRSLHSR